MSSIHDAEQRRSATASDWLRGARPHTWANALSPVIVGSAAAYSLGAFSWWRALLALVVAWFLIVGVNFANDYSDGIRGTDDDRSGPTRLTSSGLVPPRVVKSAAFTCFGIAGIAGIALSLSSSWWLLIIGVLCILGAWFYTGGKHPYGYRGLGEVAVFLFFGLVAVLGTQFTQAGTLNGVGCVGAVSIGAISASVNLANNLRDIPSDRTSGKITLAVKLGDARTRVLWNVLVCIPFLGTLVLVFLISWWSLLGFAALPFVLIASRPIRKKCGGRELIPVLGLTGRAMMVWSVATTIAVIVAL